MVGHSLIIEARRGSTRAMLDTYRAALMLTGHPAYVGLVNEISAILKRTPALQRFMAPHPQAMVPPWRAFLALLDDLDEHNIEGIVRPLIRAASACTLTAFEAWVETERAAHVASAAD